MSVVRCFNLCLCTGTSYVLMPDERNSKSQTPIEISVCTDSVKCSLKEL